MAHYLTRRKLLGTMAGLMATAGCMKPLGADSEQASDPTYGETKSNWPMLGHDPQNTGAADIKFPEGRFQSEKIFEAANEDRTDAPISASQSVFVSRSDEGDQPEGAFALTAESGDQRWRAADVVGYTTPSVYGKTIIFSGNGTTSAVNVTTGNVHWQQPVGASGFYRTHLKIDNSIVVSDSKSIVGLDASTGEQLWESPDLGVISGLTTDGSRIYVTRNSSTSSGLVALSPNSGEVKWKMNGMAGEGRPVVSDGLVYHTDIKTGTLRAFNSDNGSAKWRYKTNGADVPPATSPDSSHIFLTGTDEGKLHVLNSKTGERKWTAEIAGKTQPVVTRNTVLLCREESIFQVSRSSQEVAKIVTPNKPISSPLSLGSESIYFTVRSEGGRSQKYVATLKE
ncbi:hypothetical protein ELS19_11840 [Halogeometricum borinquense]|uniref:Pyrrolo-quinoline quinone repeat domain-containing protein n=1 Tax=Halogeometricum borinquense TaxID=60847 RepID=A0A482TCU7_9EURY|nr:PQQ-binding-like beta-propeller repeat protein [Halogeometricum borinquense]RYJ14572.1 hypothetical protein ELS19_11840 [Halogeometricum borinquense]